MSAAMPCTTCAWRPYTTACRPQNVLKPAAVPAPPRKPYRSIRLVERPLRPAAIAEAMPAGPPPSTTTSYSPNTGVCRLGSRIGFTASPSPARRPAGNGADRRRRTRGAAAASSRNDRARPVHLGPLAADHQLVSVVCLLADVLEELRALIPRELEVARPWRGIGARIVDGDGVIHQPLVEAREALHRMQLLGVRQAAPIEPEPFVEAGAVDDERVAFPPADRVAVIARREVIGVRTPVHVDRAERVRTADIEDVDSLLLGQIDELDAVRRQELPRGAGRLAARVRFELMDLAVVVKRLRPRLERHLFVIRDRIGNTEERRPYALLLRRPAAEQDAAVLRARRRSRRRSA